MSDLVARMRFEVEHARIMEDYLVELPPELVGKAADEIERLETSIKKLQAVNLANSDQLQRNLDALTALSAEKFDLKAMVSQLKLRIFELENRH
jgi:chromosome segregation ATPase